MPAQPTRGWTRIICRKAQKETVLTLISLIGASQSATADIPTLGIQLVAGLGRPFASTLFFIFRKDFDHGWTRIHLTLGREDSDCRKKAQKAQNVNHG
jgi:hypothetical protein